MYNPCFECKNRYGKEYSEECDNACEYANAIAKLKPWGSVDEIVDFMKVSDVIINDAYEKLNKKDTIIDLSNDDVMLLKMAFKSIEEVLEIQLLYDKCSVDLYNSLVHLKEKLGLDDII